MLVEYLPLVSSEQQQMDQAKQHVSLTLQESLVHKDTLLEQPQESALNDDVKRKMVLMSGREALFFSKTYDFH